MSSSSFTPEQLIAAVQRSPELVAVHNRTAWCDLYAVDAQVNDPVGSKPHIGRAAIERFYDTFIAPNGLVFRVDHDVVCGLSVFRDLVIQTTMSTGVVLNVPMHLRYDLVPEHGVLKIRGLFAHWELLPMILQLLGTGPKGWLASMKLTPQLLGNQGLAGMIGFLRGFRGVGRTGKSRAQRFLTAVAAGDQGAAAQELGAQFELEAPAGGVKSLHEFAQAASGLRWYKMLSSGNSVTATVTVAGKRGVVQLQFADGDRISKAQLFL